LRKGGGKGYKRTHPLVLFNKFGKEENKSFGSMKKKQFVAFPGEGQTGGKKGKKEKASRRDRLLKRTLNNCGLPDRRNLTLGATHRESRNRVCAVFQKKEK